MDDKRVYIATAADAGKRLDAFLGEQPEISRSRAAALIREGRVSVENEACAKPSLRLAEGMEILLTLPEARPAAPQPQDIALPILWQDADVAVVNKPCGMVVHPAAGNEDGTLVNALLYHLDGLSGIGGEVRPGIVHRLDKDTSGVMVVAKNDSAHQALSAQFQARTMEKHYRTMVYGAMREDSGRVDAPIGRHPVDRKKMAIVANGRPAATEWRVLQRLSGATLLDVHLLTGRTHQIRVHMQSLGHPVLGDAIYAPNCTLRVRVPRLMLHAFSLAFDHPCTGERLCFEAPVPEEFEVLSQKLSGA